MLAINWDDVWKVVSTIKVQLIVIAVIVVIAIIAMIAVKGLKKSSKKLVRSGALLAMFLGILVAVNSMLTGPLSTMLDLVSAKADGTISDATANEAKELAVQIEEEGIMLLENDGTLPLAEGSKLNVFGWASTNAMLGGGGSGALNESYESVPLLKGLNDAGIETNTDLSQFYVDYKADRPVVGM